MVRAATDENRRDSPPAGDRRTGLSIRMPPSLRILISFM
jgi:hypothetical protein